MNHTEHLNITLSCDPNLRMHRFAIIILAFASSVLGSPVSSRDTSTGCSKTSFSGFAWTIESFDFHASYIFTTPAHQNSWGYVDFNLTNPAIPDLLVSCSAQSDQLYDFFYGNLAYNCTVNGELAEPGPAPAKFKYNKSSGEVDINQTWTCDDVDPQYP